MGVTYFENSITNSAAFEGLFESVTRETMIRLISLSVIVSNAALRASYCSFVMVLMWLVVKKKIPHLKLSQIGLKEV